VLARVAATGFVIVGAALLLAAWLIIGRQLRAGGGPSLARMRGMVAAWSVGLVVTPPLFSRDLMSYAAQANLLRVGHNPYQVGPWVEPGPFADSVDPLWAATPAPYGPLFLSLGRGVSEVTGDSVYLTVIGMRLLAVAGVALLVFYLPRLAERCGVDPRAAMWLALLNPLTFMHFVSGGHNDALMIGLVVAGLCLRSKGTRDGLGRHRHGRGVKAPAAIALAFVGHIWAQQLPGRSARSPDWPWRESPPWPRSPCSRRSVGSGTAGWPLSARPRRAHLALAADRDRHARRAGRAGARPGNHTYELVDQTRFVFGTVAVLVIAAMALRPGRIHPVRAAAIALFLIVVLGPVVQPWYLMWALILVAAAGVRAREAGFVTWGVIVTVLISQLNGSTMVGAISVPGTWPAWG
jgi:alpha-1,6-mannosyltransferase